MAGFADQCARDRARSQIPRLPTASHPKADDKARKSCYSLRMLRAISSLQTRCNSHRQPLADEFTFGMD